MPDQRYTSADTLARDLQRYLAQVSRDQKAVESVHWGVMRLRNRLFTGRQELLRIIRDALVSSCTVALTGLPGIGKTELAIEYAYRHQHDYTLLQWVLGDSPLNYVSGLLDTARRLNLPEKDADDALRTVAAVENWLSTHEGWLLIIDNLIDAEILERLLAFRTRGHVLITSRSHVLPRAVRSIPVPPLTDEEGVKLLVTRTGPGREDAAELATTEKTALAIHEELCGVPLALDQAASFIEDTNIEPWRYLEILREKALAVLMLPSSSGFYPRPVAAAWLMLIEQLEQKSPLAATVLCSCVFLQPDFIPIDLLKQMVERNEAADCHGVGADAIATAVRDILRLGLLSRSTETGYLTIHRLVQVVLRDRMEPSLRRDWAERTVRAVSAVLLDEQRQARAYRERLLPHASACVALLDSFSLPRVGDEVAVARLLRGTGALFYDLRGMLSESLKHLERALAVLGWPIPQSRLVVRSRLAVQIGLWLTAQLVPARPQPNRPAIQRLKEAILAYERLGVIYWFENDPDRSVFSAIRALNLSALVGDSPERTRSSATACLAFGVMGLQALARRYRTISKTLARRLSGEPQTSAWVNLLIGVYSVGTCEWEEAETALRQAVSDAEPLVDHRLWAQSSAILGDLLLHRGMFATSLEIYRQIVLRGTECNDKQVEAWGVQGLVQNFLAIGETADARILTEESIRLLPAISRDLPTVINTHALHATLLWTLGDIEIALAAADRAGRVLEASRAPAAYYCYDGYRDLATIYLSEWHRRRADGTGPGEIEAKARRHCEGLSAFARVFPLGRPAAWRCLGTLILLSGGSRSAAIRAWRKALAFSRQLRLPREEALTHAEIALQATFLSEDKRAGHQQFAEETARRLGFVLHCQVPRQHLRSVARE